MISHPLDAPSNLSDSVSSIMRLLISNRIIAAGAGVKERGKDQLLFGEINLCQNTAIFFLPSLTRQLPSATSAYHFRVLCTEDPMR